MRVLPAFIDFNVSSAHYHLANATVKTKDLFFTQNYVVLYGGDQIAIEFDLQADDLAKTVVTINGLIAQNGPNIGGFAPISLQLNGHSPFKSNYTVTGGGYQATSQSFSAPPEQLVAGSNTLTLIVAPNATNTFWLYRLQVDVKPS